MQVFSFKKKKDKYAIWLMNRASKKTIQTLWNIFLFDLLVAIVGWVQLQMKTKSRCIGCTLGCQFIRYTYFSLTFSTCSYSQYWPGTSDGGVHNKLMYMCGFVSVIVCTESALFCFDDDMTVQERHEHHEHFHFDSRFLITNCFAGSCWFSSNN